MGLFFIGKNMDSQGALKQLQDFNATRKSAGDYYNQAQGELGVGAAQQQANDLRGTIRNTESALKAVPSSVSGRTQGSLVTEAQRSRLQNIESDPIAQRLNEQNVQYGDQMQQYRDLLGQAQTRSGLAYQSDTDRARSLQETYQNIFAQEQEAERKRQQEEENRRWWEQFNYSKQKDVADTARLERQVAATRAGMASIGSSPSTSSNIDWNKITSALNQPVPQPSAPTYSSTKSTNAPSFLDYLGKQAGITGGSIAKNGPLALLGKGIFW